MKKLTIMKSLVLSIFLFTNAYAVCVHEYKINTNSIQSPEFYRGKYFSHDGITYHKAENFIFNANTEIYVQEEHQSLDSDRYNQRYLEYYSYSHIQKFIQRTKNQWNEKGYKVEIIGKSLEGRDLFAIFPKNIDPTKKTLLMYGRHHGDEGTANWIIEGFVDNLLAESPEFFNQYQIFLYPMVNPDGTEAKRRYNSKGRDLNRVWHTSPSRSLDEVSFIHKHVKANVLTLPNIPLIALDMHGSFTEDFIFRVDRNFRSQDFYNRQANFITSLGGRDEFQNGNAQTSNGHPKMGRIYLVREFGINALTHETPRDIRKNGSRQISDLRKQGLDILETIKQLY